MSMVSYCRIYWFWAKDYTPSPIYNVHWIRVYRVLSKIQWDKFDSIEIRLKQNECGSFFINSIIQILKSPTKSREHEILHIYFFLVTYTLNHMHAYASTQACTHTHIVQLYWFSLVAHHNIANCVHVTFHKWARKFRYRIRTVFIHTFQVRERERGN